MSTLSDMEVYFYFYWRLVFDSSLIYYALVLFLCCVYRVFFVKIGYFGSHFLCGVIVFQGFYRTMVYCFFYHITGMYEVWIQSNANPSINWEGLELGGCLFLKIFRRTWRRGERAFCSVPPSFWRRRRRRRRSEVWRPPPRRSWSCLGPGSDLPAPILVFFNKTKSVGAMLGE